MRTTKVSRLIHLVLRGMLLLTLASCIHDNYDDEEVGTYGEGTVGVELTLQTRSTSDIASDSKDYVPGSEWENYINLIDGDYRIYFFTYDPATETAGSGKNSKLIAEFHPTDTYSTDLGTYTTYTLSGEIDKNLIEYLTNFKVVVIANWGSYPNVTPGTTTLDDICNAGTFSAFVQNGTALMPSSMRHIPFFGLREYKDVKWKENHKTYLNNYPIDANEEGAITLLRAVAKVEVIITEDSDVDSFDEVSIVNYNTTGYCAPTGVYLKSDYDHGYTWGSDFVDALHLVNDKNDSGSKTMSMQRTAATPATQETWTCYLTEYNNESTDYSSISVKIDNVTYPIYFGNYTDGTCTAYDAGGRANDRYHIYRNYLYRFYVTTSVEEKFLQITLRVWAEKWEELFDNEYIFGETD